MVGPVRPQARWPTQRRCVAGGLLATGSVAALAIPGPAAVTVVSLALLGAGLGAYIPANNAQIMAAVPVRDAATAGGMVNMTRGLGTALGVAALTAAALAATWAGTRSTATPAGAAGNPGQEVTGERDDRG